MSLQWAAMRRSAGSRCGRLMDALTSTTSSVRGISETGPSDIALRNHLGPSGSRTSRPRSASSRVSHKLIDARRSAVPSRG